MVCSPGRTPTQSQLVHYQRANVAMSRARDQCILVRSLDITDIPNVDDAKIPIIEFFQSAGTTDIDYDDFTTTTTDTNLEIPSDISRNYASTASSNPMRWLLVRRLAQQGYKLRSMGIVWKNGICVEHPNTDARVALMVDDVLDMYQDWVSCYRQQQKIERVGWKCLRVDILSLLYDCKGTIQAVVQFLNHVGIEKIETDSTASIPTDIPTITSSSGGKGSATKIFGGGDGLDLDHVETDIVSITSDDEDNSDGKRIVGNDGDRKKAYVSRTMSAVRPKKRFRMDVDPTTNQSAKDEIDEDTVGSMNSFLNDSNVVVDLSFLRGGL
jgi:hypothetical protein